MGDFRSVERGTSALDEMAAQLGSQWGVCSQHAEHTQLLRDEIAKPEWGEPQSLIAKIEPEPYPIDALPPAIRAAVEEVTSFVKAPIPLVASSALTAVSLAIQSHVDVKRAERLIGPVSLFMLTIADSGERKSTCDAFFTRAIRDYQDAQAEQVKPLMKDYQAATDAWEARRNGTKDKLRHLAKDGKPTNSYEKELRDLEHEKPEAPRAPRLLYADATPEALAHKLAKQWPSAGLVSSEAGIVFGAHGMGKESVMRNLSQINVLWDGGTLSIDRRTTESFTVKGARLTVGLQVQESTLREAVDRTGALMRGTGFFARFLMAWPESTQGYRLFTEAPDNWPALEAFNRRVAALLEQDAPIDESGALSPFELEFSAEAKAEWRAYHDTIEGELRNCGEFYDVRDVASKSADNAARLAALFQVFEQGIGAIRPQYFTSASRVAAWHLNESRRFFGELAMPVDLANAVRLDRWLLAYCKQHQTGSVSTRTVQQNVTGLPRESGVIQKAAEVLEEYSRARLAQEGRRRIIKVNPALLTSATATQATPATHVDIQAATVAKVASVAVANHSEKVVV